MSNTIKTIIVGFLGGVLGSYIVVTSVVQPIPTPTSGDLQIVAGEDTAQKTNHINDLPEKSTEDRVIATVESASPAVVSIKITKEVAVLEPIYTDPFENFFNNPFGFNQPEYRENGTERREIGGGSGFIVSSDGLIVTNKHVVSDIDADYTVTVSTGDSYEAEVLARDPVNDLAVLKIDGSDFKYLEFADSKNIAVGQTVIAIGNALAEFQNSVSVGIVSGLSRSITAGDGAGLSEYIEDVIQTDAAINPGNSGGPLLNLDGNVIGVNVAVATRSENIGFALPGNLAQSVVQSVQEHGRIIRPFLGVRFIMITDELQKENQLTVDYGALIIRGETAGQLAVSPGSPADKAGLVENDIILEIDGVPLKDRTLASIIREKEVGQTITLTILHDGEKSDTQATLVEIPE